MDQVVATQRDVETVTRPLISWGAVFGGVSLVLASSLLLLLLGAALGITVADVTDGAAIADGLGWGTALWLLATTAAVYFIGGLVGAFAAGDNSHRAGLMHGVVVWALATVLTVIVDVTVLSRAVPATAEALGTTAGAVSSLGGAAVAGAGSLAGNVDDMVGSQQVDRLVGMLREQIATRLAEWEAGGGADPRAGEIQAAIEQLRTDDLRQVAAALIDGDAQAARATLASRVDLTRQELDDVIAGVQNQIQRAAQTPAVQQVADWTDRQLQEAAQGVAQLSGGALSRAELSRAAAQIDGDVLAEAARAWLFEGPERAREVLAAGTPALSAAEVDAVIEGVGETASAELEQLTAQVEDAIETATDYAQALVWWAFVIGALSLAMAAFGGFTGADGERRGATRMHARAQSAGR